MPGWPRFKVIIKLVRAHEKRSPSPMRKQISFAIQGRGKVPEQSCIISIPGNRRAA